MKAQRIGHIPLMTAKQRLAVVRPWVPSKPQQKLIDNPLLTNEQKMVRLMLKHRSASWKSGGPEQIKRGDYLVQHRRINADNQPDSEYFNAVVLDHTRVRGAGWSRGLKDNIYFKVPGGPHVLVMDNHTFAGPFILEMCSKGVIAPRNGVLHIDNHLDIEPGSSMNAHDYFKLKTDREKFEYVIRNIDIASWSMPLFESSVVKPDEWKWLKIQEDTSKWVWACASGDETKYRETYQDMRAASDGVPADVVDIDIDVLSHMDIMIGRQGQLAAFRGEIDPGIDAKLKELAQLARAAKVVTIATSPCYIEQGRAFIYMNWLIRHMMERT